MFHKWNDLGRQSLHRQGLGGFQRNEPWKKKFSVIIINNYDCDDHGMYCDHLEANLQLVSLLLLPVPAQVGHIPLDLSKFDDNGDDDDDEDNDEDGDDEISDDDDLSNRNGCDDGDNIG